MLIKLTLDWNCVIEVEENRPQADSVKISSFGIGKVSSKWHFLQRQHLKIQSQSAFREVQKGSRRGWPH